jgi:hypothetical protein
MTGAEQTRPTCYVPSAAPRRLDTSAEAASDHPPRKRDASGPSGAARRSRTSSPRSRALHGRQRPSVARRIRLLYSSTTVTATLTSRSSVTPLRQAEEELVHARFEMRSQLIERDLRPACRMMGIMVRRIHRRSSASCPLDLVELLDIVIAKGHVSGRRARRGVSAPIEIHLPEGEPGLAPDGSCRVAGSDRRYGDTPADAPAGGTERPNVLPVEGPPPDPRVPFDPRLQALRGGRAWRSATEKEQQDGEAHRPRLLVDARTHYNSAATSQRSDTRERARPRTLLSSLPYRTSLPHRCRDFSPGSTVISRFRGPE